MKRTLLFVSLTTGLSVAHAASFELDPITVTSTREGQSLSKTPAAISQISGDEIDAMKAQHASQILNQAAGVWVNITGGEGHVTAIRQPLTTSPMYLYLEDGIPTRSTGFFNHNALYEVNLPQADGVEINKGPSTALYGSDAIGGVINVLTKEPSIDPSAQVSLEGGSFGWSRGLISLSDSQGENAVRADLNITHTDGWRDHTAYDRQSATLRFDRNMTQGRLKTVLTASNIDQDTAGTSTLSEDDYRHHPTVNYTPISYRKVQALRLSSAYEYEAGDRLYSVTPYLRDNSMELLANWSLSYDPTVYQTSNRSFGLLAKIRQDFAPLNARLIIGVDTDLSPGDREEDALSVTSTGSGYTRRYTSYTVVGRVFDYQARFQSVSPYVHSEFDLTSALRLTAGLRFDHMTYDYNNNLSSGVINLAGRHYYRPEDANLSYQHWSPKLGATLDLGHQQSLYAAYNHAFRAPSEGQLFRPGAAKNAADLVQNTLALKPIKADSLELGYRGALGDRLAYNLALYRMEKTDDVVSLKNPLSNETQAVNAGKTRHQGVELGVQAQLWSQLQLALSYSHAKHSYEDWQTGNQDFSGNDMATAPRNLANTRLTYTPFGAQHLRTQLEWQHLGSYWLDDANTQKYAGHDVVNLRTNYSFDKLWSVFASINNLADVRFAESASLNANNPVYSPGTERAFYLGVEFKSQ